PERSQGRGAFATPDRRAAAADASETEQARAVAGSRGEGGGSLRSQLGLFARLQNRACSFAALASQAAAGQSGVIRTEHARVRFATQDVLGCAPSSSARASAPPAACRARASC